MRLAYASTHTHTHTHTHRTHSGNIIPILRSNPVPPCRQPLSLFEWEVSSQPLQARHSVQCVPTLCTLQWKVLRPYWMEEFLVSVHPHTTTPYKGWSNRPPRTQQRKQSGIRTNNNIRATKFQYAALFIHQRATIKMPNTDAHYLGLPPSRFQNFCKHFPSQRVRIVL